MLQGPKHQFLSSYCLPCEPLRYKNWKEKNPEKALRKERNQRFKQRYSITIDRYEQMLADQHGVCAVCKSSPSSDDVLQVDHDHETGAIRALLCGPCNSCLGKAKDDPARLRGLADYVEQHKVVAS